MSYTSAQVTWEKCQDRNYNSSSVNRFGDTVWGTPTTIKARKQPHEEVVKTADGRELLTKNIFYVDPLIEANASKIERLDKLDGELVEAVYPMCDLMNHVRMLKFITV